MSILQRFFFIGSTIAMIISASTANALSYVDILGKWCGVRSNPNFGNLFFTRDTLTVVYPNDGSQKTFKIREYKFSDSFVEVRYLGGSGDPKGGTAGNDEIFSAIYDVNGSRMYQRAGSNPTYEFNRC